MTSLVLALVLTALSPSISEPAAAPAVIQNAVRDVPVGDPLRRTLLDALRRPVEDEVNQPVRFVVDRLRVQGDWAYYAGEIQAPNGRAIDFTRAGFDEVIAEGMFDGPTTYGLLRRQGNRWRVVVHVIGPTDVAYLAWPGEYGAPASLFE
ncbi:hypothetical protein [Brevundimonas bacteroides]|uniref:hypothetical protein n=1 Tax=Brevundimonas bacteroides TaxID=74311 RepID=UPI00068C3434|nr:hypothetical protein [Brevundimonas bacteroides]